MNMNMNMQSHCLIQNAMEGEGLSIGPGVLGSLSYMYWVYWEDSIAKEDSAQFARPLKQNIHLNISNHFFIRVLG